MPVVAQRQPDHWSSVAELQRRAVEVRLGKMRDGHERDAMLAKELLRQARSLLQPAELRELAKELQRHRSWAIHHGRLVGLIGVTRALSSTTP